MTAARCSFDDPSVQVAVERALHERGWTVTDAADAVLLTDGLPTGRNDGATIAFVEPEDASTWCRYLGCRRATLLDRTGFDRELERVLREHGPAPVASVPGADRRRFAFREDGCELIGITPFECVFTVRVRPSRPRLVMHLVDLDDASCARVVVVPISVERLRDDFQVRAQLVEVDPGVQRRVHRAALDLRASDTVRAVAAATAAPSGWYEPTPVQLGEALDQLVRGGGQVTIAHPSRTSTVAPRCRQGDELVVDGVEVDGHPVLAWTAAGGRVTITASGAWRTTEAGLHLRAERAYLPDRRRSVRLRTAAAPARVDGHTAFVTDVSATGMGITGAPSTDRRDVVVTVEGQAVRGEVVGKRPGGGLGLRIVPAGAATFRGAPVRETSPSVTDVQTSVTPFVAERVEFGTDAEPVVGLWNECGSVDGERVLVVVPPTWARTKESTSVLAQLLSANLSRGGRRVAVLRFDFRNARGESYVRPEHRSPGHEALGFRPREALDDISAAITYGSERLGGNPTCVLVGMSFSGPLCMAAAASDARVDALTQVMAASDLQDLIRLATGGVDVVAELRAGTTPGALGVLGVLMDPAVSIADGQPLGVLTLADMQDLAGDVRVPMLWVTGDDDGFVDPERVRTVLARAGGATAHVAVPCGHVPTSSSEVVEAYGPVVGWLRSQLGIVDPTLVVPDEAVALDVMRAEFERAPKLPMPAPADYWRRYMLGASGMLGYEILALTPHYRELMHDQVAALAIGPGDRVADLGAGLGHLLPHLPTEPACEVHLLELVPELLEVASARPVPERVQVETHAWDAQHDDLPPVVAGCDAVLMSLFLTTLPDPLWFLDRLHRALRPGTRVVASSVRPDADLSLWFGELVDAAQAGRVTPPMGLTRHEFLEAIRAYQGSAAELLRHVEEGRFTFFSERELAALFVDAGFRVVQHDVSMGGQGSVVVATR